MICPSRICKSEIPDDSIHCDQCGIKILRCQKCNSVALRDPLDKFCGKCGGVMVFKPLDIVNDSVNKSTEEQNAEKSSNQSQILQGQSHTTQIISIDTNIPSLKLFHSDGWFLDIKDGNTLGREFGEFVSHLGVFPVISARHAKVSYKDDKWYITDLHSTNKTYINNTRLIPDNPTEIKNDDMLVLANIQFTAKIT